MMLSKMLLTSISAIRLGSPLAYLIAVGFAAGAVALRFELGSYASSSQFITYYPAVLAASLFCGAGPAVVTSLLCGAISWYFILPREGSWAIDSTPLVIALVLYF